MCNKAVDNYPHALEYVSECYKTCDKAVDTYPSTTKFVPECFMTLEMWDKEEMCDEDVDDSLAALKIIPDWFVTSKMIKKLYAALYADENILYFNQDSTSVVFSCNGMGILNIDFNNINFDNNFDEDNLDTIILLAWHINFEKLEVLKKRLVKN